MKIGLFNWTTISRREFSSQLMSSGGQLSSLCTWVREQLPCSLCPFQMTSANSAKRLSCSKIKTLTVAPFHLMAMLKLSPIKCWSDTTLENACSHWRCHGPGWHTKPLLKKLRAGVNRHGNWFQWHKLIVFWASSSKLSLTLSIVFPPSLSLLPLLMVLYVRSFFWCEWVSYFCVSSCV